MKAWPSRLQHVALYACPLIAIFSLNSYLDWPRELSHSILLVVAAALIGWLSHLVFEEEDRRLRRYALVFGLMLMLAQVSGAKLDASGTIADSGATASSFVLLLLSTLSLTPAGGGLFIGMVSLLKRMQSQPVQPRKLSARSLFWISFGLIMLSWLPALLAYWPGVFSYDIERQLLQAMTGEYSDHHPIAHTLLLECFYRLGLLIQAPNVAFGLYSLFQMSLTALSLSFILHYLWRSRCPRWFCLSLLAMFCLAPFHQLLAISTTKDVLFTDALAVWAVLMVDGIRHPEKRTQRGWNIGMVLTAVAASLMRTNGIAAIAAVLLGGWILLRFDKKLCKRMVILALCALTAYFGIHAALVEAWDVESGPFQEVLNVPIQQICRVNFILPRESRDEIRSWIPDANLYQPALTDYVKHNALIKPADLPEFLSFWAKLGVKYPVIYLDAFGFLTKGYWHLDDMSHATFRGELLEYHEGYLGTIFREYAGVQQNSQWPALYDWYEQMYSVNEYLQIPLFSVLTSTALWCWLLMAALFASLYLRRPDTSLPLIMGWVMMCVLIFIGPCCIVRYVYPFMFIVPLCLGALIAPQQESGVQD